jgi:hypothetical protein
MRVSIITPMHEDSLYVGMTMTTVAMYGLLSFE